MTEKGNDYAAFDEGLGSNERSLWQVHRPVTTSRDKAGFES